MSRERIDSSTGPDRVPFSDEAIERAAEAAYYSTLDPEDEDAPSWGGLEAMNSDYPKILRIQVRAVVASLKGEQ